MRTDDIIKALLDEGRLRVDFATGHVYAPKSNTPDKPLGAKSRKGYLRTCINRDGKQVHIMLHRVVCIAAHGMPPSPLTQVNHIGDGKTDNRPDKIEWASQARNMGHAKSANLLKPVRHDAHYNARLSTEQVTEIRRRSEAGERSALLADAFAVSQSHIRRIITGRRWSEKTQERPHG